MKKKGNEKIGKEREKSIAERFAEELVEEIKEDFKERQQARRPYELSWQLNMNFLAGNQYCSVAGDSLVEDEKTFEWQENQVFNHIAPVYETRLAKLSRVRPKMTVRPFTDEDKDVNSAKLAKKILESCSEKLSVNGIIDKGTMWSEACGTVFYKIVWDKEKGVKIKSDDKVYTCGDVSVSVVPPFEIYPDSSVCADLDECKSIIHAKAYSSAEVKEIWGADVKGEELKVFSLDGGVSMGGRSYNKTAPGVTEQVKKDAVLVIERYTRPTKQNPDGELTVVAGDVLVYSGPLPYRNGTDGERDFPFVRQVSILWAGCFWGVSMIERLVPLQRAYNAVKCRKHEFLNRISMGVLAVEDGSIDTDLVDGEWLTPGKVLVYRQGANLPRLLSSGSVPDDFNLEEQRLLAEFLQVSGVSEFMRNSKTQTGLTSGVALQLLIEQDDTRLAVSAEQIRGAIKTVGQHILRLYKQFATAARLEKVFSTARACPRQLAVSSLVLLNKTDLATEAQCAEAKALILRANPAARIRRTQFGRFEPEWLSLVVPDVDVDEVLDMPDITLQKAVLQIRPTMPFTALQKCLVQLAGETWRIKGFVRVPEGIFYVDCTGPEVRLTPWQGEADNRLVLLAGKGMQLRRTARTAVQWYNDYIEELSMH